jgi:hypothetical protein
MWGKALNARNCHNITVSCILKKKACKITFCEVKLRVNNTSIGVVFPYIRFLREEPRAEWGYYIYRGNFHLDKDKKICFIPAWSVA